jgi:hypothetical protein
MTWFMYTIVVGSLVFIISDEVIRYLERKERRKRMFERLKR